MVVGRRVAEEEGEEGDGIMGVVLVGGEEGVSRGGREVEGIIDLTLVFDFKRNKWTRRNETHNNTKPPLNGKHDRILEGARHMVLLGRSWNAYTDA
jgi:hypothetical protein